MTHELKTPISTISLSSELLLRMDEENNIEKVRRYAGIIYKENKRLENQVERVLNVAKLDKDKVVLNKENFNIHELLDEVKDNFEVGRRNKGYDIDYASTVEDAYDDLNKILGGDGIKRLTADTQGLMQQQMELTKAMEGLEPMFSKFEPLLDKAKDMLKNLPELDSGMMDKLKGMGIKPTK